MWKWSCGCLPHLLSELQCQLGSVFTRQFLVCLNSRARVNSQWWRSELRCRAHSLHTTGRTVAVYHVLPWPLQQAADDDKRGSPGHCDQC